MEEYKYVNGFCQNQYFFYLLNKIDISDSDFYHKESFTFLFFFQMNKKKKEKNNQQKYFDPFK